MKSLYSATVDRHVGEKVFEDLFRGSERRRQFKIIQVTQNPMTGILSKGEEDVRQNGEARQEARVKQRSTWLIEKTEVTNG